MGVDKLFKMIEDAITEVGGAVVGGMVGAEVGKRYGNEGAGAVAGVGASALASYIYKRLAAAPGNKTYTAQEIRAIVDQEIIARNSGR